MERARALAQRQLIIDYKQVFAGTRGARVLQDLKDAYNFDRPTASSGTGRTEVFRREAMKHPIYHILARVNAVLTEEDIKPKAKRAHAAGSSE